MQVVKNVYGFITKVRNIMLIGIKYISSLDIHIFNFSIFYLIFIDFSPLVFVTTILYIDFNIQQFPAILFNYFVIFRNKCIHINSLGYNINEY